MRLLYLRFINLSGSLPILGLFGKTSIKTGENIHWKSSLKGKEPFADQKNSLNADLEREGSSRNERCFHFLCLRISRTSYISAQSIGQLLYVIVYGYVRFRGKIRKEFLCILGHNYSWITNFTFIDMSSSYKVYISGTSKSLQIF